MRTTFTIESEKTRISIRQDEPEGPIKLRVMSKEHKVEGSVEGRVIPQKDVQIAFENEEEWASFRNLLNQFFIHASPQGATAFSQGATGSARARG